MPSQRTPVWLPPGGRAILSQVAEAFGFDLIHVADNSPVCNALALVERYFDVREYTPMQVFSAGSVELSACRVPHTIDAFALRVQHAGHSLVYSGDTAGGIELVEHARGCDVLLCEASAVHRNASLPPGHLSASDAGVVAAAAGAGRLVLTHVIQYDATEEALIAEASRMFNGLIDVASPGRSFTIE